MTRCLQWYIYAALSAWASDDPRFGNPCCLLGVLGDVFVSTMTVIKFIFDIIYPVPYRTIAPDCLTINQDSCGARAWGYI